MMLAALVWNYTAPSLDGAVAVQDPVFLDSPFFWRNWPLPVHQSGKEPRRNAVAERGAVGRFLAFST